MKTALVSLLLGVVALTSAVPLKDDPVAQRMLFCHQLGLTFLFARSELTHDDWVALGKCKTEAENFFYKKFGLNYNDLAEIKTRYERDQPELRAALASAALAFGQRLKGTQTMKDLTDLNIYLKNHKLPTYEDMRHATGL